MLTHLFRNRQKPGGILAAARCWASRARNFPALLSLEWNKLRLRWAGARISSTAVCAPVRLQGPHLTVGSFTSVGRAYIQAFDEVSVGDCVVINDGVTLISGTHDPDAADYRFVSKPISIKAYAWIAMNATILPGVTIGKGAIVGAGSVVTKSVGDYEIVAGNPARLLRKREERVYSYRPAYWFGPVASWIGSEIFRRDDPSLPDL